MRIFDERLWPVPRHVRIDRTERVRLPRHLRVRIDGVHESTSQRVLVEAELERCAARARAAGFLWTRVEHGDAEIVATLAQETAAGERSESRVHREGEHRERADFAPPCALQRYTLRADRTGLALSAVTAVGLRHGLATLAQVLEAVELSTSEVPTFELHPFDIHDEPHVAVRGVLLDVSRSRVPTMERLYALVERLAQWKINHLQLYTEHTFAYRAHATVWSGQSPFTADEVRALDDFCHARGIELAPNQQSFGHFHRWLEHERYRDLAELPEGIEHAFSRVKGPYSLDLSNPRALELLEELYDELLPCFRSRQINVGLDETIDLGLGRSRAACDERGRERVYLEHVQRLHALLARRGVRMQFWGDIILTRPELVAELPRDLIALEWGYDAGHPFAEHLEHFARSGLEHWVCPGTSSWQSIAGRTHNMLANVHEATRAAADAGARGVLVTDWGDRGHHQPPCVRDAGLLAAAGLAWNARAERPLWPDELPRQELDHERLAALLDLHAWHDEARVLGRTALLLGETARVCGSQATNGSALFFVLAFAAAPFPPPRAADLEDSGVRRAREHVLAAVRDLSLARGDPAVARELAWCADMLVFACDFALARFAAGRASLVAAVEPTMRAELALRSAALIERYRALWLASDRPGGLDESTSWLDDVRRLLEA